MNESSGRTRKYRQAALYYLLLAALYEGAVWHIGRLGLMGPRTPWGPSELWLLVLGPLVAVTVFFFLWFRENRWVARLIAVLGTVRLVYLIPDAFLRIHPEPVGGLPYALSREFYIAAFVIVAINVLLMARAGWDL